MARPSVVEDRREQILDGLFAAMAEHGSDAASVTEIASRSGVPRGLVHYYFHNKDEMRRALMRRMGDRYVAGLEAVLAKHGVASLVRLVRFNFQGNRENTRRLLGVWIDFWGQANGDAELRQVVADVQARVRACFVEGMRRIHPQLPPADLEARAACATALLEGLQLQWKVCVETGRPFDVAAAALVAEQQVEHLARMPGSMEVQHAVA